MTNPEIIEVDTQEQIVQETNTGKVETTTPAGPQKQQWAGYYVNYRYADIHRLIEDALYSIGGFAGISDSSGNATGGYSYLRAYSAEYMYIDRSNCTGPTHDFSNFIGAKVDPVFASELEWVRTQEGKEDANLTPEFENFVDNADSGASYIDQNMFAAYQIMSHYVVFGIMDKVGGKVRRYIRGITSTNENFIRTDEAGDISKIAFLEDWDVDSRGDIIGVFLRKYFMANGTCWSEKIRADWKEGGGKSWKDIPESDYESAGAPRNTGVDEMIAKALVFCYEPGSKYVPQNPPSKKVVWKYADHNAVHNEHSWLFHAIRNPVLAAWDVEGGMRAMTLGAAISLKSSDDGASPPRPEYVQPENGTESLADLERSRRELHDVMLSSNVKVVATNQAESAQSKSYDFKADNDALNETVKRLKRLDKWCMRMYNKLTNTDAEYSIKYPSDFYPKEEITIADAIDLSDALTSKEKYEASEAVLETVLSNNIGGDITRDKMDAIKQEFQTVSRSEDNSDIEKNPIDNNIV